MTNISAPALKDKLVNDKRKAVSFSCDIFVIFLSNYFFKLLSSLNCIISFCLFLDLLMLSTSFVYSLNIFVGSFFHDYCYHLALEILHPHSVSMMSVFCRDI